MEMELNLDELEKKETLTDNEKAKVIAAFAVMCDKRVAGPMEVEEGETFDTMLRVIKGILVKEGFPEEALDVLIEHGYTNTKKVVGA